MEGKDPKLLEVWSQKSIPVVYRQEKGLPILLRLPYAATNRDWLRGEHRNKPNWNKRFKCWEAPRAWFEDVVRRALAAYQRVYVIQPFQQHQKCATSCWNATGVECECSCMGAHHGSGNPAGKWHVVSDTFAIQWEQREYACRLIERPAGSRG